MGHEESNATAFRAAELISSLTQGVRVRQKRTGPCLFRKSRSGTHMSQLIEPLRGWRFRSDQFQVGNLRLDGRADWRPCGLEKIGAGVELVFAKGTDEP